MHTFKKFAAALYSYARRNHHYPHLQIFGSVSQGTTLPPHCHFASNACVVDQCRLSSQTMLHRRLATLIGHYIVYDCYMYLPEVISLSNLKETYFVQEVTRSRRSSKLVSYRCCLCLADLVTMHTAFEIIRFLIYREVLQNKQWCLVYIHELRFTACTLRWKLHVSHQSGHISLLYTWQGPASLPACFRVYIWVHNWNFRLVPTTFFY